MEQKCVLKGLCPGYRNPVAHDGTWSGSLGPSPWAAVNRHSWSLQSLVNCHAWSLVPGIHRAAKTQITSRAEIRKQKKVYKTISLLSDMDTMITQERKDEIILSLRKIIVDNDDKVALYDEIIIVHVFFCCRDGLVGHTYSGAILPC